MAFRELDSPTATRDFSRRDFVRTTVGSGFAAAVLPVGAQTVRTDSTGLAAGSDAAKRSQVVVYPNTPHAFYADYRPSYRKDAADDGWRRCVAWFKDHGVA